MLIDIKEIKGEPGTGFEPRIVNGKDMGEFECENCEYFKPENSSCGQKEMIARSKQPLTKDGRREVKPDDCCEFVDRLGKVEEEETEPFDIRNATWIE